MRIQLSILCLLLICFNTSTAQTTIGFSLPKDKKRVEIPFEQYNNLVVIPVTMNNFLTMKFILDTGVNTPILTEELYARILGIKYFREIFITGPGIRGSIHCKVGKGVSFNLPGGVVGQNLSLLVLQEDHLNLSEKIGDEVYGIIGYDIFSRFVVEIDYDKNVITLHKPEHFKPRNSHESVPMVLNQTKPYITSMVSNNGTTDSVSMMIDSGASHAMILDLNQTHLDTPCKTIETQLGTGLGGIIPGQLGRIDGVRVNNFAFSEVLVSIPEDEAYSQVIKRGSRHGTVGGEILQRFNPVFDYANQKIYIEKGSTFNDKFEYDMSGLSLVARGEEMDTLVIDNIRKESPAMKAGLCPGDTLLAINGRNLYNSHLSEIYNLLRRRPGKKIRIKKYENGQKIKVKFRLERAI